MIRVAVGLYVRPQDGAILCGQRADNNRWELPGGKVRYKEDETGAVAREWCEELGVRAVAVLPTACGVYQGPRHTVTMYRIISVFGSPRARPGIHTRVGWLPLWLLAKMPPDALNDAMTTFCAALAAHTLAGGAVGDFGIPDHISAESTPA